MPELPDLEAYIAALVPRITGQPLEAVRVASPFLLRTVEPPLASASGRCVERVTRLGKRLVFALEGDFFLLLHLMVSGRLHWRPPGARLAGKMALAAFDFPAGALVVTEASARKRAALHAVAGEAALAAFDAGGLEPLSCDRPAFNAALTRERHTLKRALTDPHLFAGIGNAYSDEILHRARLSPAQLTTNLDDEEQASLFDATRAVLVEWRDRLVAEAQRAFPKKVTAFRTEMAVHGKYGQPCPECSSPVQRIVYASNESNYCARCQTGGRLLADRAYSRLLKADWPKTLDELEARRASRIEV